MADDTAPPTQVPPAKRIFLVCDGTSEDATKPGSERNPEWTNPHRFMQCIAGYDERNGMMQSKHYLSGLATTSSDWANTKEAAFGVATIDKIFEGYHMICNNCYRDDDEIVLVGFSRGAYIAKVIARWIDTVGLVQFGGFSHVVTHAWENLRMHHEPPPTLDDPEQLKKALAKLGGKPRLGATYIRPRILACIAWDTVKALKGDAAKEVAFLSDQWVSKCGGVRNSFHALSMNEQRKEFEPLLWTQNDESHTLKQCWFLGHHSDVGGATSIGAANISLAWMISNTLSLFRFTGNMIHVVLAKGLLNARFLELVNQYEKHKVKWVPLGKQSRTIGAGLTNTSETVHWTAGRFLYQNIVKGLARDDIVGGLAQDVKARLNLQVSYKDCPQTWLIPNEYYNNRRGVWINRETNVEVPESEPAEAEVRFLTRLEEFSENLRYVGPIHAVVTFDL